MAQSTSAALTRKEAFFKSAELGAARHFAFSGDLIHGVGNVSFRSRSQLSPFVGECVLDFEPLALLSISHLHVSITTARRVRQLDGSLLSFADGCLVFVPSCIAVWSSLIG